MSRLEKILLYLGGKMNDEELAEFKEQLKIDPDLMAELDVHRLSHKISGSDNEERFRETLANTDEDDVNERLVLPDEISFIWFKKYGFWILSSVAAAIIILLIFLHPFKQNQGEIFTNYYQPYDSDYASRSSLNDSDGYPEKAVIYYLKGNYDAAYEELMIFSSENSASSFIYNYYLGLTYIEKEKYNLAVEAFENVLREDFSFLNEHAQWYLSLSYVKLEKYNLARENLMDLKLQESIYSKRSKKILLKLPR